MPERINPSCGPHRQRRVHRRPGRLHHERRLPSAWGRRRRPTGTRWRTSVTRASSTTTSPTRRHREGGRHGWHRELRPGRRPAGAARHRPAARRRPLRRQLRHHRRRPRRGAAEAARTGGARRRGARPHRSDAPTCRRRPAALLDPVPRVCRRSRSTGSATTTSARVATDTMTFEVCPCEDPAVFMPVHMIQLRDMGLVAGPELVPRRARRRLRRRRPVDFLLSRRRCRSPARWVARSHRLR